MNKSLKIFFRTVIVCLLCCGFFVGVGYFYISSSTKPVENDVSKVPYYSPAAENSGVMFEISGDKIFFDLDFENESLSVIFVEDEMISENTVYGYDIDYTVSSDYNLLSGIIDIVGGIDLNFGEETLNYTGVQVTDILSTKADSFDLKREIVKNVIEKISKNGFQKQDFLYIIENSNTNLTVPACYNWSDYISELCKCVNYIN